MQNDALLLRSRNFASICSTGEKRGIAEQGIEISDSNLNSAFERQPCSAAKQLEVGTVCAVWHKKTAEKWALSPLWKNRFKLAPRVPKPRFKKLVKNCQRFSSFILFFLQPLPFSLFYQCFSRLFCAPFNAPFSYPRYALPCLKWFIPERPAMLRSLRNKHSWLIISLVWYIWSITLQETVVYIQSVILGITKANLFKFIFNIASFDFLQ